MTVKQCYWVNLQCAVGNVASVTLGYTEPIWNVEYQYCENNIMKVDINVKKHLSTFYSLLFKSK